MCVSASRTYAADTVKPARAGSFASAAVLSALGPADWQICQDAKAMAVDLTAQALDSVTREITVDITVHSQGVVVSVRADAGTVSRTITPRSGFVSPLVCHAHLT